MSIDIDNVKALASQLRAQHGQEGGIVGVHMLAAMALELVGEIERLRKERDELLGDNAELLTRNDALAFGLNNATARLERAQPVLDAARAWHDAMLESSAVGIQVHDVAAWNASEELCAAVDELDRCPVCGPGGCAGHTRKPSEVELPKLTVLSCPCGFTVHATGDVELNADVDCPIHGEGAGHTKVVAEP